MARKVQFTTTKDLEYVPSEDDSGVSEETPDSSIPTSVLDGILVRLSAIEEALNSRVAVASGKSLSPKEKAAAKSAKRNWDTKEFRESKEYF